MARQVPHLPATASPCCSVVRHVSCSYSRRRPERRKPHGLPHAARDSTQQPIGNNDLRADLWQALFQLGVQQAAGVADQAIHAAADAAVKLQRYLQPPPPGFPPGPPGDQSVALLADPLALLDSLHQQYGGVAGFLLGGERVVVVSDPAAARQVLLEQPEVFVKEGTAFFPGSSLTGNGLLVSDGPVWQRQRRLSNPAFRQAAVAKYAEEMVACTQQMLEGRFAAGGVQDVYAAYNELTLNITLSALFGMNTHNSSDSTQNSSSSSGQPDATAMAIVSAVEDAFAYFTNRGAAAIAVPEWVPTPDNLAFQQAVQQLDEVVYGIIAARRSANAELEMRQQQQQQQEQHIAGGTMPASPAQGAAATTDQTQQQESAHQRSGTSSHNNSLGNPCDNTNATSSSSPAAASTTSSTGSHSSGSTAGARPTDLLQALLDSKDDSGVGMSDTALRDELMTLLVAGQETSAILLAWSTALLAAHPQVQAAVAAEVDEVLQGEFPAAGDVGRLPGVVAVVLEALRVYPPAYLVGRCANAPVQLAGGYQLPAGTTTLVSPYLLHKHPTRWKQPDEFRPSRWLSYLQRPQQQQQQPTPVPQEAAVATNGSAAESGGSTFATAGAGSGHSAIATGASSNGGSKGANFMAVLRDLGPNGAYVPFGGGPRNCIGTGFAMMEAVLVLAMLLQRYEVQPAAPDQGLPIPKPLLTLRPGAVEAYLLPRSRSVDAAAGPAAVEQPTGASPVLVSSQ